MELEADYQFECQNCHECCRHYQFVQLYDADILRLIKSGHDPKTFLDVKKGMPFLKHENGKCCFLDKGCIVHKKGKPAVCRSYPLSFRDACKGKTTICVECPGIEIGKGKFNFEKGLEISAPLDNRRLVSRELDREIRSLGKKRIENGVRPIEAFSEIFWLVKHGGIYEEKAKKENLKPNAPTNLMLKMATVGFLNSAQEKMPGKGKRDRVLERVELARIVSQLDIYLCDLPLAGEILYRSLEKLAERDGSRSAVATLRVNELRMKPLAAKLLRIFFYRCL